MHTMDLQVRSPVPRTLLLAEREEELSSKSYKVKCERKKTITGFGVAHIFLRMQQKDKNSKKKKEETEKNILAVARRIHNLRLARDRAMKHLPCREPSTFAFSPLFYDCSKRQQTIIQDSDSEAKVSPYYPLTSGFLSLL